MQQENAFSNVEFDNWAYLEGLFPEEKYLFERYLDKSRKTIEAGVGGGRILLGLQKMGFTSLYGFDCEHKMIEVAKQRDQTSMLTFEIQDATRLKYEDSSFEQAIYLQQIMSFIVDSEERLNAYKEVHRILKPGGTVLFSLLNFDGRREKIFYKPYLEYISFLRKLKDSNLSIKTLPWLRHNNHPNLSALIDKPPYVYWYTIEEASQILKTVGFEVVAVGSSYQIEQGKMLKSGEELINEPLEAHLYFVCTK